MKLPQLFLTVSSGVFAIGIALISGNVAHAQETTKWKLFRQSFTMPRYPSNSQDYEHRVTLDKGKFVTRFVRQFAGQGVFTGVVTTDLAEIDTAKMKFVKGKEGYAPDYWYFPRRKEAILMLSMFL